MRSLRAILAGFLLASLPVATAAAQSTAGVEQLYSNSCIKCHGDAGQGGGAGTQTLLTDELMDPALDRPFFDTIKHGKPDAGMEAFGETLNDAQVWGLVGYIRELQHRAWRDRAGSPEPDARGVFRSQRAGFKVERIVERGLSVPWSVDFLPGGKMLIADRDGDLFVHSTGKPGGTLSKPVAGTPRVRHRGQGGLMDVAVHPNYAQDNNGWVYLSYSEPSESDGGRGGMTRIVRGRLRRADGAYQWVDQQPVWQAKAEHYLPTDLHYGCRIVFDPADPSILYFAIGDRGRMEMAQDRARPNGKVHRIRDDGAIPADNPFVSEVGTYGSIWTYGNRNPQGMAFDLAGRLWITEHGPRGGDELNRVGRGKNYGWPTVSFGFNYNGRPFRAPWPDREMPATDTAVAASIADGVVMPVYRWLPSIGACGLDTVRGEAFPAWRGDLLAGGLSGQNVDRLRLGENGSLIEREELIHGLGRVRDVVCAPDGTIYIALNGPDHVIRLVPAD